MNIDLIPSASDSPIGESSSTPLQDPIRWIAALYGAWRQRARDADQVRMMSALERLDIGLPHDPFDRYR
ncbi:hypothetical protein [Variovorax ginsengisoli]|jgi:hypothetical protein|uniref:DUF1127 domain-containing protein n=1 Tax=Variovorax ginsengisoli TaxID=363844 RepID=A0ABT8S151_9BURK|nr:hypothetical protein [Variovorax ginsengisoli]MDN8613380.1 hypothetical protein [Variovorax ginsengisoli]MDO1532550.1 hypothetical protein [Variovorax ginsengisoli]